MRQEKAVESNRGKLDFIQASRGFAALSVLLFHANATFALPKYFGRQVSSIFSAGDSGVQFFFVISGAVMVIAHYGQIGRSVSPMEFYMKRFLRLYPPLWVVLSGLTALALLVPNLGSGGDLSIFDIFKSILIIPSVDEPLLAVEWTLRHEVLFYAIFGILLWSPFWGAALLSLWALSSLWLIFSPGVVFPWSFVCSQLHILFIIGMAAGVFIVAPPLRRRVWLLSLFAIGLFLFSITWFFVADGLIDRSAKFIDFGYGVGAASILISGSLLAPNFKSWTWRCILFLGNASYSIYLVHFPAISLFTKLSRYLSGLINIWVLYLFVVVASMISGLVFYAIVERPMARGLAAVQNSLAAGRAKRV